MTHQQLVTNTANLLATSLSPASQKQAEAALKQLEGSGGFLRALWSLVEGSAGGGLPAATVEAGHVRMAAAVHLKNFIRTYWPLEGESLALTLDDRAFVRAALVPMMLRAEPAGVQAQVLEALVAVAALDFPQTWPALVSDLIARLSLADLAQTNAVLKTLHRIFKRYRQECRSDELYTEINYVMAQMGPALLSLCQSLQGLVEREQGSADALRQLLQAECLCNKIFLSLSAQDLPAFFEDNLEAFMAVFEHHYGYRDPRVASADDEAAGPAEKLPVSVAKIITLYAQKYEEDFLQLPRFVQASWAVLTGLGGLPRDDKLAAAAMAFLSVVAKVERHKDLFGPVLQLICDKIVLPSLIFREGDLELFEDEPLEFIRRDQDIQAGSAAILGVSGAGALENTRRGSAVALTRGLMEFYEAQVTNILASYLDQYLASYKAAPGSKWREKDVAIQIFSAIAIKGSVVLYGVTRVNEMLNIADFFRQNILPDLQPANEALHPILKMDAIKFLNAFRNQLGKADLAQAFPMLMHHLTSHNHVIYTYAAIAVERILAIRPGGVPMFTPEDLGQVVEPLCLNLLKLITSKRTAERMAENDLIMKALMRVLLLAGRDLLRPLFATVLDQLADLLFLVAKNPSNPRFSHFLFESIAVLVKECGPIPECMVRIEGKLLPVFQGILQDDEHMADFFPYILQIFTAILEIGAVAGAPLGLPSYLKDLLAVTLQPALWGMPANVPALVRFVQGAVLRDSPYLIQANAISPIFGIFQTLMSSRTNDWHAFSLLNTLLQALPSSQLQPYLQPSVVIILKKLQAVKQTRIQIAALMTICHGSICLGDNGAAIVFGTFEGIQSRMFGGLMRNVLLPAASKVKDAADRKVLILGLTRFLDRCPPLLSALGDPDYLGLWTAVLATILNVVANLPTTEPAEPKASALAYESGEPVVTTGQGGSFSRLQVLPTPPKYPYLGAEGDPVTGLVNALLVLAKQLPEGQLASIIATSLPVDQRNVLHHLFAQMNVSI